MKSAPSSRQIIKLVFTHKPILLIFGFFVLLLLISGWSYQHTQNLRQNLTDSQTQQTQIQTQLTELEQLKRDLDHQLASVSAEYQKLASVDQKIRNDQLEATISAIQNTYDQAVTTYEDLLKLREQTNVDQQLDEQFTQALIYLSQKNYSSASAQLKTLQETIDAQQQKLAQAAQPTIAPTVKVSNQPPDSGYSRQNVQTDVGNFLVSMTAAPLSSTKVIVDTASPGTCHNDCPVLSLSDYISRNGAYAGINGSYFCPASYPSCAGKTNSFDTLLMNKDKTYFNSDNNVYSSVPAVIFGDSYVRFVAASSEWGRDTSINSMIANQPLVVFNSQRAFGGDGDPKKGSKAGRSFVANKGNTVYIGVVHSATVVETGYALEALGMENALNLDSGGSTAFWSGGYKAGPGRHIPNAILLVSK